MPFCRNAQFGRLSDCILSFRKIEIEPIDFEKYAGVSKRSDAARDFRAFDESFEQRAYGRRNVVCFSELVHRTAKPCVFAFSTGFKILQHGSFTVRIQTDDKRKRIFEYRLRERDALRLSDGDDFSSDAPRKIAHNGG